MTKSSRTTTRTREMKHTSHYVVPVRSRLCGGPHCRTPRARPRMPATRPRPCRHDRVAPARRLRAWLVVRLGLRPHPQLGACTLLAASCAASTWCCNALGSDCRITPPRTRASCHASASREVVSASSESSEAGWERRRSMSVPPCTLAQRARQDARKRAQELNTDLRVGGPGHGRIAQQAQTAAHARPPCLQSVPRLGPDRAQTQHVHSRPDIS